MRWTTADRPRTGRLGTVRRARRLLGTALVGALVLAACGGDDDDDDAVTEQTDASDGSTARTESETTDGSTGATEPETTDGSTSESTPATGATPEGELVIDVASLNSENFVVPLGHEAESTYTYLVYEPLLYAQHDTLELMPGLATEWETSEDGLTWTFTLRDGVMFHDSEGNETGEFTSADVKATIETAMGTNSTWYALTTWQAVLDSIDTPDPSTVVINLTAPYPGLLGDVSSLAGGLQILSADHLADVGVEGALTDPVGTGPYVLESQSRGASMTFRALPEHWRVVPEFETIRFDIVPEETTRLANVRSGSADIAQLSGASLASAGDVTIQETPDAWTSHMTIGGLYFDRPEYVDVPYADANVRKAFSMAIDREALAETLYGGAAEPGTGWGLYTFSSELTPPPYDPDEARRLLEEANWPSDYTMELWVQPSPALGDVETLTEAIGAMLGEVGVNTSIVAMDLAQGQQLFQAFQTDGAMVPSGGRFWYDPQTPWQVLFHSGSLYQTWYSEEMDSMLDELAATIDADEREALQRQIHDYMIDEEMIDIPLLTGNSVYGLSEDVGEWPALRGPIPMYFEYTTHADPLGTFRLFEP